MSSAGLQRLARHLPSTPMTVSEALHKGAGMLRRRGVESARLDVELLLALSLGWRKEQLYLNYERLLEEEEEDHFESLLRRRAEGEPIAYIAGRREFWSLDFQVTPDVLVPRPETERLVEMTLALIAESEKRLQPAPPGGKWRILDLGTGSGAIAVTLAKERADVEIWATDLSSEALRIARVNAERHQVNARIHFRHGDLFSPVRGRWGFFHGVVSNPPYVRGSEFESLRPEVREWEPRLALDGGPDGLNLYRPIVQQGHLYLQDGGWMALEIGPDEGEEVCRLLRGSGRYSDGSVHRDYSGRDRVVSAKKLPRPSSPGQEA